MRVDGRPVRRVVARVRPDGMNVRFMGRAQSGAWFPLAVVNTPPGASDDEIEALMGAMLDPEETPPFEGV